MFQSGSTRLEDKKLTNRLIFSDRVTLTGVSFVNCKSIGSAGDERFVVEDVEQMGTDIFRFHLGDTTL